MILSPRKSQIGREPLAAYKMDGAATASSCFTGCTTEEENTDVDSAEDNDEGTDPAQMPSGDES